jgi:hypothetical protein
VIKPNVINKQRGQFVRHDIIAPVGVCDYSGFFFSKSDLVKQYEWRGNDLVWTGFLVGRPFVDEPNEQNRPPLIKGDPKAVLNPRPQGTANSEAPDAIGNNSASILENVNFNSEDTIANLPDFAGEDISQLNDNARLNSLYQVGV